MQKMPFVDDNLLLGECYVKRDYSQLREKITGGGVQCDRIFDRQRRGIWISHYEKSECFRRIRHGLLCCEVYIFRCFAAA